ncbi:MAG TPA: glycosyltransferase family 4 protein [Cyclobacteriaceae bacterium]|nr:glycosyltransferase family 4 protein [Cyclobacteriaceae bacterium]
MTRISYLVSHPIQYFSPLFRTIAETPGIELTVYYCHNTLVDQLVDPGFGKVIKWDIPLLQGYRSVFLRNVSPWRSLDNRFFGLINFGIVTALKRDKSQVVIVHGWSYFTNYLAVIASWCLGKQVWLRGENPLNQELRKPAFLRTIKNIFLRYGLFAFVDKFLFIGKQNRSFYLHYGVRPSQLIYAPYAVDNLKLTEQASQLVDKRGELRRHYAFREDTVVILFAGKFIEKKRPKDVLRAAARLTDLPIEVVMMGDGPLRDSLLESCKEMSLNSVRLTGFVNQTEIVNYYALADIFVLPSGQGETWGLVVNEAMLFGLPVVVSETVGSADDLVVSESNGYHYPEGDIDKLASCLRRLAEDGARRRRAGEYSRKVVAGYSYDVMIEQILQALKH